MMFLTAILAASSMLGLAVADDNNPSCTVCVDHVNACGKPYGECYDFCAEPRKEITVPGCNGSPDKPEVCEYFKNDCGVVYGGCYDGEDMVTDYAVPACPPATPPPDESCQVCVDLVNGCNEAYGSCYDFCADRRKEFTIPACNGTSGRTKVCEYNKNDCGVVYGGCYDADGSIVDYGAPVCPPKEQPDPSCQICLDFVNDCQKWYGGCVDPCANPHQEFDIPACDGVSGQKQICDFPVGGGRPDCYVLNGTAV